MKVRERKYTPENLKWRLEDIFATDAAWEAEFADLSARLEEPSAFRGRLTDREAALACLKLQSELGWKSERLYVYARMRRDEDSAASLYQGMSDRTRGLAVKLSAAFSFAAPELTGLSSETLAEWAESAEFADFSYFLTVLEKHKKHILSEKEEELLASVGAFSGMFQTIFSMFDNADIRFGSVTDEKGRSTEITHGTYSLLLQSPSESVRKSAFEAMFGQYKGHINTLAQVYAGNVKKDCFYAKMRGFGSALEHSLFGENTDPRAYRNLVDAIGKNTKYMHRFIALKKKILQTDTLNMYDLYLPLVENAEIKLPYEKAYEVFKEAVKPLGSDYAAVLDEAYNNGWIDVSENKGKRSGAYSWGVFGTHPYVLLNYQPNSHAVFTVAHEMGHAMHTYYSSGTQPYEKAGYEIFVAEVASTVNEVLLLKYLMKTADEKLKRYLLSYYLDMFRTTVFRQTMFAEFELAAHTMEENGQPLTAESLSEVYYALNKKYYGKAVKHNDLIRYEWARIPHFYTSFYVYKYATGLTAAVKIASMILSGDEEAVVNYRKFLSAGGSMPPVDVLKLAGVDLTSAEPFEAAMKEFKSTLTELEKMI
ncbi:MAG: oligoendopeptidase F [Clostridiaceae bacterium]|jgi:oligoendopeptidase F|nr:oligoendopeptidase F [Clostridiaceae bacterium]